MSIIMSTPEQIHNGPVNSSTAKNLWSFPKEERFNWQRRDNNASPNRFYNLPNIFDKRSTSFGYGTKSNFTQSGRNTPPPNAYNLKTAMDFNIMKRKGYTFGLSRNQIVTNQASPEKTPGPGSYKARSGLEGAKYSMGARITSSHDNLRSGSPGPGSYRTLDGTNPKGSYFYSKFKNSGAGKFSPSTSPRFNNHSPGREYPGPGAYAAKAALNETGFYFDSKFQSSGARTFGAGSRDNLYASAGGLPGPGYYRLPSEFGYYESSKAHPDMKPFVKVGSVRNRRKKF